MILLALVIFFVPFDLSFCDTISGNIFFKNGDIPDLENQLVLVKITIEDAGRQDVGSIEIAKKVFYLKPSMIVGGNAVKYELKYSIPMSNEIKHLSKGHEYTLTAVVNCGWKPSGDDWIRKGDYLTTEQIEWDFEVHKDITVEKYA